jgi:hypothetical protein
MSELKKDTMILFSNVQVGKNKKGGDYIQLTLKADQVQALVAELTQALSDSPTEKAKIALHISDKVSEQGRQFKSAIAFIRPGQEFGANPGGASAGPKTAPAAVVRGKAITKA